MKGPLYARCAWSVAVSLTISTALSANAQTPIVRVIGTSVHDDRDTQGSFLSVKIKVQSNAFAQAHDMRFVLKTAVDSTGRNLLRANSSFSIQDGGFRPLKQSDHNSTDLEFWLESPRRKAMTVKQISGDLEIYTPHKDPSSVVLVDNFQQHTGRPVLSSVLKSEGLTVEMWTKEEYAKTAASKSTEAKMASDLHDDLAEAFGSSHSKSNTIVFHVTDPHVRLVGILVEDAHGKRIHPDGGYTSGTTQKENYFYDFNKKLPPDARVKLYVATPRSITKAPFQVKDLPLP